jgi:flagellar biosynthesis GTPase FlhF
VKIIELFTLHVLPRNDEWEYSTEFINLSEVLDEERKDLFLQTLEGLREEKERGEMRAAELQRAKDEELERQLEEERREAKEAAAAAARPQPNGHKRNTSEVDYGIEKSRPHGSPKGKGSKATDKTPNGKPRTSLSSSSSKNVKKQDKAEPRGRQTRAVATGLRNLIRHIVQVVSGNPMSIVRTLLFVIGILMAMSRQGVRDRVRGITDGAWQKIKATAGMGVKVSYI